MSQKTLLGSQIGIFEWMINSLTQIGVLRGTAWGCGMMSIYDMTCILIVQLCMMN